jgi:hypothetical protein
VHPVFHLHLLGLLLGGALPGTLEALRGFGLHRLQDPCQCPHHLGPRAPRVVQVLRDEGEHKEGFV